MPRIERLEAIYDGPRIRWEIREGGGGAREAALALWAALTLVCLAVLLGATVLVGGQTWIFLVPVLPAVVIGVGWAVHMLLSFSRVKTAVLELTQSELTVAQGPGRAHRLALADVLEVRSRIHPFPSLVIRHPGGEVVVPGSLHEPDRLEAVAEKVRSEVALHRAALADQRAAEAAHGKALREVVATSRSETR